MPTLDELAAQVAALQQQVSAITTPPTEYYTSIYSGEEIDAAITKIRSGPTGINPNLLDNWYFGNPINQRGQTSYNTPGYSIDRWYLQGGSFELSDNALTFLFPATSGGVERFNQKIPLEKLTHGVYTISVLTTEGLYSKSFEYEPGDNADVQFNMGNGVYVGFYTQGGNLPAYRLFNAGTSADISVSIIATKLELGGQQTLAHQDEDGNWVLNEIPDYWEELAKCQRYFWNSPSHNGYSILGYALASSQAGAYLLIALPVSLRDGITPSLSTINFSNLIFIATNGLETLAHSWMIDGASAGDKVLIQCQGTFITGQTYLVLLTNSDTLSVSADL